jgi:AraC-like DNA-binding protein
MSTPNLDQAQRPVMFNQVKRGRNNVKKPHSHTWGQLLHAAQGVMEVHADGSVWVVPPQRAVWVPPHMVHYVQVIHPVILQNIYIDPTYISDLPSNCHVVHVSPLLRELINEAVQFPEDYNEAGFEGHTITLLLDCLKKAATSNLYLPLPSHGTLQIITQEIKSNPNHEFTLDQWADHLGTTSRTLARQFKKQTDMTFGQWRQQARLMNALSDLAQGKNIARIAHELGYSSQSAFSAMFKKALGITPGQYFKQEDHEHPPL